MSKGKKQKYLILWLTRFLIVGAIGLAVKTAVDMRPLPGSLTFGESALRKVQVLDRHRIPLTVTYENDWNLHAYLPLHRIPRRLQRSFVTAEDSRFYRHGGADWIARLHALYQNLKAGRTVRGASTISEQVVRMLHRRPRTLWSRWLEGWEAARLEKAYSKADILEFYLNQVPFAARRRGVLQAAHYYFDRDLDTLSPAEMLALAVLVRAPSRLDLHHYPVRIDRPLRTLADRMLVKGDLTAEDHRDVHRQNLQIRKGALAVDASHFIHFVFSSVPVNDLQTGGALQTTLDAELQQQVQNILDGVLRQYRGRRVENGAVLVVDHHRHEILAWVNGGRRTHPGGGSWMDAVLIPRQPGSALKPFLYALALEDGWTAATLIEDSPLSAPVGAGLHPYHNYSRNYYGPVRLRTALGNSLNTPALRTIRQMGIDRFFARLRGLGFESLHQHPDFYGDGLALGNGEVTLYELVRAYTVLANRGRWSQLRVIMSTGADDRGAPRQVFSEEITSLIGDILSDPGARRLEFGYGGLLRMPTQTAVKTGTSNDYRDAWALGYNSRFTVGVWMGNLNGRSSDGVSGAGGPALILRSVFNELNHQHPTRPLYMSPSLVQMRICGKSVTKAVPDCPEMTEWFVPDSKPEAVRVVDEAPAAPAVVLLQPINGLHLARDPRIPDENEALRFALSAVPAGAEVRWFVDDIQVAKTTGAEYLWSLVAGRHRIRASIDLPDSKTIVHIGPVAVFVK
jgi:penicillin-binding protein 1C